MMSLKVLIVDDDPIFVMMHKLKIRMTKIADNPQTYNNGKAAFDSIINDGENDDTYLVFLDLNMPIMTGWDLLNAIQLSPISNKIFVALVSSSIDKNDRDRAKTYPQVIGFFEKALNVNTCMEIKNNSFIAPFFSNTAIRH